VKSKHVRFGRAITERWNNLHTVSDVFMIGLGSIHLVLHWDWMVNLAMQLRNQQSLKAGVQVIACGGCKK